MAQELNYYTMTGKSSCIYLALFSSKCVVKSGVKLSA
jgi:hypothetical protein